MSEEQLYKLLLEQLKDMREDNRVQHSELNDRLNGMSQDVAGLLVQDGEHRKNIERFYAVEYGPLKSTVERNAHDISDLKQEVENCHEREPANTKRAIGGGVVAGGSIAALVEAVRNLLV